jgi:hypothetical protein
MQPRKNKVAWANPRVLAAASVIGFLGATSAAAASVPGTLDASVGPVGPAALHVGRFGSASASATAIKRGKNYGGKTSQSDPFVLGLSTNKARVARLAMDIDAPCTSGMTLSTGGVLTANLHVSKTGAFKGTATTSMDTGTETAVGTIDVKGKVRSRRASGTLRAHFDFTDKQTGAKTDACDTGSLRWGATSAKARVYGGSTSQHDVAVLELSRDLRRVSTLRIGWQAPCTPQGGFHVADVLTGFGLSASRSFGGAFSVTNPGDGGGQIKADYQVQGKAGKSKASGRLQVHITSTDATGATVATCDSGVVSWHAASG